MIRGLDLWDLSNAGANQTCQHLCQYFSRTLGQISLRLAIRICCYVVQRHHQICTRAVTVGTLLCVRPICTAAECLCVCVCVQPGFSTNRRNDQACPQPEGTSSGRRRLRSVLGYDSNLYYCRLVSLPLRNTAALPRDSSKPLFAPHTHLYISIYFCMKKK